MGNKRKTPRMVDSILLFLFVLGLSSWAVYGSLIARVMQSGGTGNSAIDGDILGLGVGSQWQAAGLSSKPTWHFTRGFAKWLQSKVVWKTSSGAIVSV